MIGISNIGRAIEVTREGVVVWEYWNPVLKDNHRVPIRVKRYDEELIHRLSYGDS